MSNKLSSVEWFSNQSYELFEQYSEGNFDRITLNKLMLKTTEKAKAMHKEEMINFADKMKMINDVDFDGNITFMFNIEENYNETFK